MGVSAVKSHGPEAFGDQLKGEIARWAKVVRDANIKVD